VCGLAAVVALFETEPGRVERLFFELRLRAALAPHCLALARARKPYRQVDAAELTRITGTLLHGGVAAVARPRPIAAFDAAAVLDWTREGQPILILDGVGNPHNLGAIARSAAFFRVEQLLLAERPERALPSDASYRVAEDGLEYLRLWRAPIPSALDNLPGAFGLSARRSGGASRWQVSAPTSRRR
jgi:RNA methyltransferase, TrmH family